VKDLGTVISIDVIVEGEAAAFPAEMYMSVDMRHRKTLSHRLA
jgi:hypothetical protein